MIDMPQYKKMETVIFEKKEWGMALIEHPDGFLHAESGKYLLLVDVKNHLEFIMES
jgi:hypothetical protein